MKKLLSGLLLFAAGAAWASTNLVNATYIYADFQLTPQALLRITQTPLAPFADYGGNTLLTPQPIYQLTSPSGSATFSNTVAGYAYRIQLDTIHGSTIRTCGYPATVSGNVNGRDYLGDIHAMSFYYLYSTNPIAPAAVTNFDTRSLEMDGDLFTFGGAQVVFPSDNFIDNDGYHANAGLSQTFSTTDGKFDAGGSDGHLNWAGLANGNGGGVTNIPLRVAGAGITLTTPGGTNVLTVTATGGGATFTNFPAVLDSETWSWENETNQPIAYSSLVSKGWYPLGASLSLYNTLTNVLCITNEGWGGSIVCKGIGQPALYLYKGFDPLSPKRIRGVSVKFLFSTAYANVYNYAYAFTRYPVLIASPASPVDATFRTFGVPVGPTFHLQYIAASGYYAVDIFTNGLGTVYTNEDTLGRNWIMQQGRSGGSYYYPPTELDIGQYPQTNTVMTCGWELMSESAVRVFQTGASDVIRTVDYLTNVFTSITNVVVETFPIDNGGTAMQGQAAIQSITVFYSPRTVWPSGLYLTTNGPQSISYSARATNTATTSLTVSGAWPGQINSNAPAQSGNGTTNYNFHEFNTNTVNGSWMIRGTNMGIVGTNATGPNQRFDITNGAATYQGTVTASAFIGSFGAITNSCTWSNLQEVATSADITMSASGKDVLAVTPGANINVILPAAGLYIGHEKRILCVSAGAFVITVKDSGGNVRMTLPDATGFTCAWLTGGWFKE
jgi:hypothetical protein